MLAEHLQKEIFEGVQRRNLKLSAALSLNQYKVVVTENKLNI